MSVQKQDEHCEWCEKQEKLLIKWAEKAAEESTKMASLLKSHTVNWPKKV